MNSTRRGDFPVLSDETKSVLMARLRGNDSVGLESRKIQQREPFDMGSAIARLQQFMMSIGRTDVQGADLEQYCNRMVDILLKSRLTVNFTLRKVFSYSDSQIGDHYKNCWQIPGEKTPSYMATRDRIEMGVRTAFGRESLASADQDANVRLQAVKTDISQRINAGDVFDGASRPQYAALDFINAKCGGAPQYGRSFYVLAPASIINATLTHCDTFERVLGKSWDTIHASVTNMYPLIANMSDDMLGKLLYVVMTGAGGEASVVSGGGSESGRSRGLTRLHSLNSSMSDSELSP
jgi:hypothetical protein